MTPPRIAAAALGALAAAAAIAAAAATGTTSTQRVVVTCTDGACVRQVCVDGSCAIETTPGGVDMSRTTGSAAGGGTNAVHQSVTSTIVQSSGGGAARASAVAVSQSTGDGGSVAAQAVATTPPGPTLTVRLPARRWAALLRDRRPLLEVSADRATAVDLVATLSWRPGPGRRARVVLVRRELEVGGDAARRLRLGASKRGLARLPERGRLTLKVTGRGADGATVGLQLTA